MRFRVYDIVKQAPLGGHRLRFTKDNARSAAHRIADFVYEKLTGEKGVFSTQIAYVVKRGNAYELQIADADGERAQYLLRSNEPIISPVWSPDGRRIAYVSFESKKPVVYVHYLAEASARWWPASRAPTRRRPGRPTARPSPWCCRSTAARRSTCSTPTAAGRARRISNSTSIDTEPRYSTDGKWIYFTSDRGGSPQIYRMPATGGEPQRVTFEGSYNVSPRPSPDGRVLAYVTRNAGKFQVALLDLSNRQVQVITDSDRDESPSFAPNGRMILLATVIGGRGVLSAVSSDGRIKQRLPYRGRRRARAGLGAVHRMKGEKPMRAIIIAAMCCSRVLLIRRGCQTTPEDQPPPEVEDRSKPAASPAPTRSAVEPPKIAAVDVTSERKDAGATRAQGPEQHPVEAHDLLRLRQVRRQGRVPAAGRGARQVPAREPERQDADPGQHRRARQPRVQRRRSASAAPTA